MAGPSEGGGMLEVVGAQRRDVLTAGDVAETERDALGNVSEGAGPLDEAGGPAATAKGRPSRPDAPEGGLGDKLSQPAGDRRAAAAMRSRVDAAKLAIAREAVSQLDDSEELEGASGMYDAGRAAKKAAGGLRQRKAKKAAQGSRKAATALSTKVSVRARTLNGEILKVNDKMGNPIEIANVVVWHVKDTAKALFDVDNYEQFVATQAETALRHVASIYAYDHAEDSSDSMDSITLRSNIEEVSTALKHELTQRLAPAGVAVDDARLTHLAYAPEIAQAMLRRQQAEAVIAARKKIVEGAVTMVEMAVDELGSHGKVELDEERKAQMASNLMVVLCGESEAKPIVNTGSLY